MQLEQDGDHRYGKRSVEQCLDSALLSKITRWSTYLDSIWRFIPQLVVLVRVFNSGISEIKVKQWHVDLLLDNVHPPSSSPRYLNQSSVRAARRPRQAGSATHNLADKDHTQHEGAGADDDGTCETHFERPCELGNEVKSAIGAI